MPIKVQNGLPVKHILAAENIFVMDEDRANSQQIRPLQIAILNLMPLKEATELDILRVLSNFPIQVEITFLKTASHEGSHVDPLHLNKFYQTIDDVWDQRFDGMIITGAPVEQMEFEEVTYWDELCRIFEWSKTHVYSTFHICWGAQAALYYHFGIKKRMLPVKLSGVYKHRVIHRKKVLMRGMDDVFYVPQSRYTGLDEDAVWAEPELYVVADSEEAGIYLILAYSSRQVFVTGHSEYDRYDLDKEYRRDLAKGIAPNVPKNYYPNDDPTKEPLLTWRSSSNCTYVNWLNLVYQETPYDLSELRPVTEDSYVLLGGGKVRDVVDPPD